MAWEDAKMERVITYNTNARKVFIDLDGVVADFETARDASGLPSSAFKLIKGSYRNLLPYKEAVHGVHYIKTLGFDVWFATKIPTKNPYAATEKLLWVEQYFPDMVKSTIITPNKGTLGGKLDFLIDDRPHKAHCTEFVGRLMTYGSHKDAEFKSWEQVCNFFSRVVSEVEL